MSQDIGTDACPSDFPTRAANATNTSGLSGQDSRKPQAKPTKGIKQKVNALSINIINSSNAHVGPVNNYGALPRKTANVNWKAFKPLTKLEEPLTPDHVSAVSLHIGEGWRFLGRSLEFTDGRLDQLYADYKDCGLSEVIYQMLIDWLRNHPDYKVGTLAQKLWDSGQTDALDKLREKCSIPKE